MPWGVMLKWCFSDGDLFYSAASLPNKPSMVTYSVDPSTFRWATLNDLSGIRFWVERPWVTRFAFYIMEIPAT